MNFVDWIPGIFSGLGMIIINSIDKSRLSADSFSYNGDGVAWKARVVLFMGFAAMAGGLAGGVTVMVLKYVVQDASWPALWFGVANVVANALVMLRYVNAPVSPSRKTDLDTARSCSGSARTWKTTTLITWRFELLTNLRMYINVNSMKQLTDFAIHPRSVLVFGNFRGCVVPPCACPR